MDKKIKRIVVDLVDIAEELEGVLADLDDVKKQGFKQMSRGVAVGEGVYFADMLYYCNVLTSKEILKALNGLLSYGQNIKDGYIK